MESAMKKFIDDRMKECRDKLIMDSARSVVNSNEPVINHKERKEKREETFRDVLDKAIEAGMQAEDGERAKAIYKVMEEAGYGYLSIGNIGMYLPMELKQKLIEEGY